MMEMQGPPWRILSIDDDEFLQDIYHDFLYEDETELSALYSDLVSQPTEYSKGMLFQLDSELSGEAGYRRVEQALQGGNPYAVILLDMVMPGWDGLKTAEMIRSIDATVRIIIITGYADYELSEIHERIGNDFVFMTKPVGHNELLQIISLSVQQWSRACQLQSDVHLQQKDQAPYDQLDQAELSQLHELKVKILLVDNSPTILAVYSFLLRRNSQYEVMVAEGVDEALEMVEEFQPDIAIIDYLMPDKNGYVLASTLEQNSISNNCRILFFAMKSEVKLIASEVMQYEVVYKDDPTEVFLHQVDAIAQSIFVQKTLGKWEKTKKTEDRREKQAKEPTDVESASQQLHWLEAILDSITEAVVVVDLSERVLFVNSSTVTHLGYQPGQLNGVPLQQLVEGVKPGMSEADCLIRCGNGRTFQAHYSRSPLKTSDEQPQHGEVLLFQLFNKTVQTL